MTCRQGLLLAVRWLRLYEASIAKVDQPAFRKLLQGLDQVIAKG